MLTESYHVYKDYSIRLRAITNGGFGFAIFKEVENSLSPNGIKRVYLRKKTYNFTSSEALMKEAKSYIDNHSDNLIKKFAELNKK